MTVPRRPRFVVARGPRAAQAQLLVDLAETLSIGALAPGSMALPVRVITATGALRRQLAHRMADLHDGAAAGVQLVTLWSLTRQLLQAAGEPPRAGDALLPLLTSRHVTVHPGLSGALNRFNQGPRTVTPAVRDLLSAGMGSAVPAREALAVVDRGPAAVRARALIDVATAVHASMSQLGAPRFGALVRRSASLLAESAGGLLPSRAVMVIGFADATGDALLLLQALCAHTPATVYLDLPDDPASPGNEDLGARFARRFAARLSADAEWSAADLVPAPPRIALTDAAGCDAEVREIAARVRALLDDGVSAESIGVVARGLEPYAVTWRRHAEALGIPFSGGETPAGATALERRLRSFVRVLQDGPRSTADAWLDAGFAHGLPAGEDDLRLALRTLGVSSLEQVARLDLHQELGAQPSLPLPVRRGLAEIDDGGERRVVAARRHVSAHALEALTAAVSATLQRLERRHETLQQHAELVRQLVAALPAAERDALWISTENLMQVTGAGFALSREEFVLLLSEALGAQLDRRLGGDGGGVQLLDTARARGLCFEHLFLLGVNRDLFPGVLRDDALLDDNVRAALRTVLPDLALKGWRQDEERLLFASLVASAPRLTLSWQRADDDGRERAVSAYVERLLLTDESLRIESVPRARIDQLQRWRVRTARESLQHAALTRDAARVSRWLPLALAEGQQRFAHGSLEDASQIARGRDAVLGEQEPSFETSHRFGPYSGFIGAPTTTGDPRLGPLAVTTLENVARCGWQALLTNYLRLQRPPDPAGELPSLSVLLVGDAAHRGLQALFEARLPAGGASRPKDDEIRAASRLAAQAVARENGLRLSGLIEVLGRRAEAMVTRAVALEWAHRSAVPARQVEVESSTTLVTPEGDRVLRFRADRLDRAGGAPVFTDYKTGKPPSDAKLQKTRDAAFLRVVTQGTKLQAAIYALSQPGAVGRYLHIDPALADDCTEFCVEHDSPAARAASVSAALLIEALHQGVLIPRLFSENGEPPAACDHCDVRAACSQDDTGAKLRLQRVWQTLRDRGEDPPLALKLWDLASSGKRS